MIYIHRCANILRETNIDQSVICDFGEIGSATYPEARYPHSIFVERHVTGLSWAIKMSMIYVHIIICQISNGILMAIVSTQFCCKNKCTHVYEPLPTHESVCFSFLQHTPYPLWTKQDNVTFSTVPCVVACQRERYFHLSYQQRAYYNWMKMIERFHQDLESSKMTPEMTKLEEVYPRYTRNAHYCMLHKLQPMTKSWESRPHSLLWSETGELDAGRKKNHYSAISPHVDYYSRCQWSSCRQERTEETI